MCDQNEIDKHAAMAYSLMFVTGLMCLAFLIWSVWYE